MAQRDVVVIGASAGGVEALKELIAGLPVDFPATVLVALHISSSGSGLLPRILERVGVLPVMAAEHGRPLRRGEVLVAPPGTHLLVSNDNTVSLSRGPRENGHRPAVDVLFRSAAAVLGPRVIGVVLSGALDDGAAGMIAVRLRGGVGVCQDPDDAQHPSMPRAAIEAAVVEHVLPAAKIAGLLHRLVGQEVSAPTPPASDLMEAETNMAGNNPKPVSDAERGKPSELTCPDCHGPLLEIAEGHLTRFRCRVGHAWSPRSLAAQQATSVENALWTAMVTLEEKATLRDQLSSRAAVRGSHLTAESFRNSADHARDAAKQIRELIQSSITEPEEVLAEEGEEPDGVHPPA